MRFVNNGIEKGWYCGYVGVQNASMLPHSVQGDIDMLDKYSESLDSQISVHGGITFDGTWTENTEIIPLTDIPADWYTYHCYGFDVAHAGDEVIGNNFEYAKQEALSMKEQMEKLIATHSPSTGKE